MKKITFITFLFLICISQIISQERFEVRLVPTNTHDHPEVACFDTQFKNISSEDVVLGGQNYRLFFDALQLDFLEEEGIKSYLAETTYNEPDLNQSLQNIDARGYGSLQFSENLGFINYSIRA